MGHGAGCRNSRRVLREVRGSRCQRMDPPGTFPQSIGAKLDNERTETIRRNNNVVRTGPLIARAYDPKRTNSQSRFRINGTRCGNLHQLSIRGPERTADGWHARNKRWDCVIHGAQQKARQLAAMKAPSRNLSRGINRGGLRQTPPCTTSIKSRKKTRIRD